MNDAIKDFENCFLDLKKEKEGNKIIFISPDTEDKDLVTSDLYEVIISDMLGKFVNLMDLFDDETSCKVGRLMEACIRDSTNEMEHLIEFINRSVGDIRIIQSTGERMHDRKVMGISFEPVHG